tara:strand:+ start:482 stop:907 length:426 start_codon:yes stop_codon:yes gene_type:complete
MAKWSRLAVGVAAAMLLWYGLAGGIATSQEQKKNTQEKPSRVLRHVVMFKFKEGTSPAQVKVIENSFRALPSKIDAIAGFEWGTDVSVEDLADGFTHCFLVTFRTQEALKAYLPHEAHQGFVSVVKPHVDKVMVLDYWARP